MFNPFLSVCASCIILSVLDQYLLAYALFFKLPECKCNSNSEENIPEADLKIEEENYYLPQAVCSFKHFNGKIINPYKKIVESLTPTKMFKSVCLQCAACVAIAQQMQKSIEEIKIGSLSPREEIRKIEKTLKSLCTNGFNKFDLRNYKGNYMLMKASRSTTHISSKMDGQWPRKLREICSRYYEHIKMLTFYNSLLKKNFAIENYLCRGDGVFRDCSNINFKNPTIEDEDEAKCLELHYKIECII